MFKLYYGGILMDNYVQPIKKKYNILFFLSLFVISFSVLSLMIFLLLINSPDHLDLKRPVPYLLLPIYLIVRLAFLKIEASKNIDINKTEEIVKFLLFIYCLTFMSIKFFPLDKKFSDDSLTITFFSFNLPSTLFTIKAITRHLITNFILFIPLGFLLPIITTKFRSIFNCAILSFMISVIIAVLDISLNFLNLDILNITSFDIVVVNVVGTLVGYKMLHFITNKTLRKSSYLLNNN